jgi:hypothetical protein
MEMLHQCCSDWLLIFTACWGVIVIAAVGWIAAGAAKKNADQERPAKK